VYHTVHSERIETCHQGDPEVTGERKLGSCDSREGHAPPPFVLFELKIHREALWTSARPASHERPLLAPLAPHLRLTPGLDLGVLDTT